MSAVSRETDDVSVSAKQCVSHVEKLVSSYRRGSKAPDLTANTGRNLMDAAGAMTRGEEALSDLGNSQEVMRTHAASANNATKHVGRCVATLTECHHTLFHVWGKLCGALDGQRHE